MTKPTGHLIRAIAASALIALSLAGCSASQANAHDATPAVAPTAKPTASSDPAVSTTCALVSSLQTTVEQARMRHDSGNLTDAQFAAVVNTAPTTVNLISRLPDTGLAQDVTGLTTAIQQAAPTVSGATFDPAAPAYTSAVQALSNDCKANGTPIAILALPGQG
jgi:hypothetical protein